MAHRSRRLLATVAWPLAIAFAFGALPSAPTQAMTWVEARAQLSRPVAGPFFLHPPFEPFGLRPSQAESASPFIANAAELDRFFEALLAVADNLQWQPQNVDLRHFVQNRRVQIAFWLQFFLAERDLNDALDLIELRNGGVHPFRDAFINLEAGIGREGLAHAFREAWKLGEGDAVVPLPRGLFVELVYYLRLNDYRALPPDVYPRFAQLRPQDLTPESLATLARLHRAGAIDLALARAAIQNDVARHSEAPSEQAAWNRFVARGWLSPYAAERFRDMIREYEAEREAIRHRFRTRLGQLRSQAERPRRANAVGLFRFDFSGFFSGFDYLNFGSSASLLRSELPAREALLDDHLRAALRTLQEATFRFDGLSDDDRNSLRRILTLAIEPPEHSPRAAPIDFSEASDGQLADGILRLNALFRPPPTASCAAFGKL